MTREISIYHEYPYLRALPEPQLKNKNLVRKENPTLSSFSYLVLYTLYKYRCLNKTSLNDCINLKNKNKWKSKSLRNALKMLRMEGFIQAYGSSEEPVGDDYKVVVYVITKKGFHFTNEKFQNLDENKVYRQEELKPGILLKQASIAQYHISLLKRYGYMINASKFEGYYTQTREMIPSYISFTKYRSSLELITRQEKMMLFGLVAPRKEAELEDFLGYFLRIINAEIEEQNILKIIILVCENNTHATWIAWKLNKYRQLRPFPVLYIQDLVTAGEDPLSQVLCCETDEEGIIKSNINFFKE